MPPPLIFRCSPFRLRGGLGSHPACFIERNSQILAQRRLNRGIFLVIYLTPLSRNIRGICRPKGLSKHGNAQQDDDHWKKGKTHKPPKPHVYEGVYEIDDMSVWAHSPPR